MASRLNKINLWIRHKAHLPIIVIGGAVILVLFFNDETSVQLNMAYEKEIRSLQAEIKLCRDSAEFYRRHYRSIIDGTENLEHVAREQYRMQRPTEDIFIIKK